MLVSDVVNDRGQRCGGRFAETVALHDPLEADRGKRRLVRARLHARKFNHARRICKAGPALALTLVEAIRRGDRPSAIRALAHVRREWSHYFFYKDHGWGRSAARHTQDCGLAARRGARQRPARTTVRLAHELLKAAFAIQLRNPLD